MPADAGQFPNEFCFATGLVEIVLEGSEPSVHEFDLGSSRVGAPWLADGEVWVFLDDVPHTLEGDTLQPRTDFAAEAGIAAAGIAVDFDGNGSDELLVFSMFAWHLLVEDEATMTLVAAPSRSFPFPAWPGPFPFAIADVDEDGILDLATVMQAAPLFARGDGSFNFDVLTPPPAVDLPWSNSHAVVSTVHDIDGDGLQDLLAINTPTPIDAGATSDIFISVHRALDDSGTFADREVFPMFLDGEPFRTPQVYAGATFADMNGDTFIDLVFADTGRLWFVPGEDGGRFGAKVLVTMLDGLSPKPMHVGDFNGDGNLDVLALGASDLHVAWGDGSGGFEDQRVDLPRGFLSSAVPRPPEADAPLRIVALVEMLPCR